MDIKNSITDIHKSIRDIMDIYNSIMDIYGIIFPLWARGPQRLGWGAELTHTATGEW